ncbi:MULTISPECIES: 5'-methylthioadenosine/adenosylhomocysteine nucleosidase [Bacillota]|jgi:adenosylhomocysteine nucleosidase|uniref:adenosylhomocysteine nucleosidase n=2 Tax=Amedibacillus TaxID=2749846 RepID=A0A7G9GLJ4_9FIRM|nr:MULTISPECIES: 5'-methylthioadenosine/adenosylhomocysteine nucleosidase [Bacillota]QNM11676.1 5'-methylthioadenosine/adenosylhomocysteine nucleosidase [[Eubacterium] hominis]MCH4285075.1 5'-methylthioadenosine/adenosylhomocysteine nucleosidase [Amedibacillus hominis]RGB56104.1 5'-methylthioadenosine/adenosylhomocysteine nucleosidase [Absiella sp. AM22-9]RGB61865.1 5'-methylthioadenosine/adenosylhomocysteine nucleosidase [Absiella sp. AM10-20]RGB70312.1 5'-methylthioadenosine/adenosylhomocyst
MIAVIAAMDSEVSAIVSKMNAEAKKIQGIEFYEGTLENKDVVVMKSGVGKGNAAMSTTILLEHYPVEQIVNIGTAGGLKENENILDAVLSERVVQHDFDTSPIDGEAGIGLYYDADPKLLAICEAALKDLDVTVHKGLVASGDQFIAGEATKNLCDKFPDAMCAEMEAGAIAQVSAHYQVPFVILRSLSDVACKPDSHMDFQEYVKHASERSAMFTQELMRRL